MKMLFKEFRKRMAVVTFMCYLRDIIEKKRGKNVSWVQWFQVHADFAKIIPLCLI